MCVNLLKLSSSSAHHVQRIMHTTEYGDELHVGPHRDKRNLTVDALSMQSFDYETSWGPEVNQPTNKKNQPIKQCDPQNQS